MADLLYVQSVAYHEAGHTVIAAVQGLRLSRHGIHLDADGRGMAYYEFRKPKRIYSEPSAAGREHSIVATYAGLIAQQKFHPECSVEDAYDDCTLIEELLREMDEEDAFPFLHLASERGRVELRQNSERLVGMHWRKYAP